LVRANHVIGVLAAGGVVALVGLSLNEDASSQSSAIASAPTVAPPGVASSTEPSPASTIDAAADASGDEPGGDSTTSTSAGAETTTSAATTQNPPTTTSAPTTTTTLPQELNGFIALQVVNGGALPGQATEVSAQLSAVGFAPRPPVDAVEFVGPTTIYYAPGERPAATAVNSAIGVPPERLLEAPPDERNWVQYGTDLNVMVILGPA
jgi:hypothetical protein